MQEMENLSSRNLSMDNFSTPREYTFVNGEHIVVIKNHERNKRIADEAAKISLKNAEEEDWKLFNLVKFRHKNIHKKWIQK